MSTVPSADDLLTDAAWLRRLALRLAGDRDDAEDLVQEARIAAWRNQPDRERSLRPWLAKVVRDTARMRARGGARRATREEAAVRASDTDPAHVETLLDRVRLYRVLVDAVLELDEPYRTTVLRRFVDGWSAEEIGRAMGVPAGTVRWRLHEALERLRASMDRRNGPRGVWLPLLTGNPGNRAVPRVATVAAFGLAAVALLTLVVWKTRGDLRLHAGYGAKESLPAASVDVGGARAGHAAESFDAESVTPSWLAPRPGDVPPAAITGVVIGSNGDPIAGATVTLQTWASAASGGDEASLTTGADGTFSVVPRLAGLYFVIATAPNHATAATSLDSRQSGGALALVLSDCDARLDGTITDAAGTPLPGATVRHMAHAPFLPAGPFGPSTIADDRGHYALCVSRGDARVSVTADGYETVEAALPVGGSRTLDVVLAPSTTVRGRVIDEAGVTVPGVQVVLWPDQRGARSPGIVTGVSGTDGAFEIEGVAGGRYEVTTWGSDTVSPRPGPMVTVDPAASAGPIDVAVTRGVEIDGVVRQGNAPVAGAAVQVAAVGPGPSRTTIAAITDANGHFAVRGAPPGPARVVVANYTVDAPTDLEVNGPVVGLEVAAHPLPSIRGVVQRGGAPVGGAEILYRPHGATSARHLLASADGSFEAHVVPGDYELSASAPGIGAATSVPVMLTVGEQSLDGVTLDLAAGATIAGAVIDTNGAPVEGVELVATSNDGDVGTATSDIVGAFRIDELTGGRAYTLTARAYPGAASGLALSRDDGGALLPITLRDGVASVTGLRVEVADASRRIAGRVVDDAGEGVPDVWVRAGVPDDGGSLTIWPGWPVARTDEDGRFALLVRGVGPVRVSATRGDGTSGEAIVGAASSGDVAILLSPSRR